MQITDEAQGAELDNKRGFKANLFSKYASIVYLDHVVDVTF